MGKQQELILKLVGALEESHGRQGGEEEGYKHPVEQCVGCRVLEETEGLRESLRSEGWVRGRELVVDWGRPVLVAEWKTSGGTEGEIISRVPVEIEEEIINATHDQLIERFLNEYKEAEILQDLDKVVGAGDEGGLTEVLPSSSQNIPYSGDPFEYPEACGVCGGVHGGPCNTLTEKLIG